ncbi:hypothetical protein FN846DRAFT_780737 [Sphaerosporella brunnea]|uniref:RNA polymerase II assembly factor Rtp1 C-terminal domain-containing protein n=1 Tax=Sphaerosporella brunnea TaxID=1250544 RepID=A0A5J5ESE7_9PEZI|nr:hypothetical protein FN846DRAFT_780737 [Sphaerosporella brunnea]
MGGTKVEELHQGPLVSDTELSMAFRNLETIMAAHPSPVIPERLISPILIPLWGLMCYAQSIGRSAWHDRAAAILKSYLAVSIDSSVLRKIQEGLLFTGNNEWEYAPGSTGGIEIRKKDASSKSGINMDLLNFRVEKFLEILGDESVPASVLSDYFLSIFRTWLARDKEEEPLKMLVTVKILQEMLQTHGERLAKQPTEILQIIKEILDEYVAYLDEQKRPKARTPAAAPSLSSLGSIVQELPESTGDEGEGTEEDRRAETVAMALTLLSVLVSSPETKLSETDERLVTTLHPSLQYLSNAKDIDPNLTSLAVNISSLLLIHAPTLQAGSAQPPLAEQQRETYATALSYLRDPLVPVRAHGLHLLRQLILAHSPIVDVTNTARLLITMLKDGDSFVYLNVVKCLAALTDRHSKTVTKMLVSAYLNESDVLNLKEKLGLDERLRIGEALLGTVQRLGQALVGEVAEVVAQGMLSVISRRRTGERLTPTQLAQREHAAKIVAGWANTPHEDLRIRASALSILGAAVQTNPSGMGPRVLGEVLNTSLAILTQETSAESAILRRAAVVAISAVLNALVRADEEDREGRTWRGDVWKVLQARVGDIKRVLGYVRVTDVDGLVREQAGVVEENLAAVLERRMLGGAASVRDMGGRLLGETAPGGIQVL